MFKLTEQELDNAFEAINYHGYSAMLPHPIEWETIENNWIKIKDYIKELDLDNYEPYKPMKIFAPKSRANLRIVHLLHPQDLIIYTALVLIVKDNIESERISKKSQRVFSFRVNKSKTNRLYDSQRAYDSYIEQLKYKANKSTIKFIGVADIADFYPRIYQHRLENIIQTVSIEENPRGVDVARVLVKKLISNLMDRNSYGIPTGPYASRILAEAILIDIDSYLCSNNVDFVRWVDDFNIFCKSEYEAQSNLFRLGEWLYSHHGLTLQSAKTKIYPTDKYQKEILAKPDENLTDRNTVIALLKNLDTDYKDEGENNEELNQEQIDNISQQLQNIDLLSMLNKSISDKALVDYKIVNYVLTRLSLLPNFPNQMKHNILNLIIENARLLYPASEQIAKYIISFSDLPEVNKKKIAKKLLHPLKSKRNTPPDYYTMWILYIFSISEDWNNIQDIINIYQNNSSEIVKRYAALAVAKGGKSRMHLLLKMI